MPQRSILPGLKRAGSIEIERCQVPQPLPEGCWQESGPVPMFRNCVPSSPIEPPVVALVEPVPDGGGGGNWLRVSTTAFAPGAGPVGGAPPLPPMPGFVHRDVVVEPKDVVETGLPCPPGLT